MLQPERASAGIVYLVGAGPGDPGLITVRGVECLHKAEVVVYDRLANPALLKEAVQAEWIDVGKQPDHHPVTQSQISQILVDQAGAGKVVVRLKGGDPFVFGRGGEEAQALAAAGIPFEVIPGITSAIAVPAYAGIPVTQRSVAGSFCVATGHRSEGSQPFDSDDTIDAALKADTRIFLMGVQNLAQIIERLVTGGCPLDMPAAVIAQGTTPHQQTITGTLSNIVEQSVGVRPPAILVVGEVVRLRDQLAWFDRPERRPLLGLRVLNTRPAETPAGEAFPMALEALGAEVHQFPVTRIEPAPDPAPLVRAIRTMAAGGYDWIVFTSANAVRHFFERLYSQGLDGRSLNHIRLGAIGKATAAALWEHHLLADFVPQHFSGLNWAAEVENIDGKRLLLPRSEIAPQDLIRALEGRGAQVEAVTAYTVTPVQPDLAQIQALVEEINVVTLFSPSAVNGWIRVINGIDNQEEHESQGDRSVTRRYLSRILRDVPVACIGPVTAEAARGNGLRVEVVADEYTAEGLVEALIRWRKGSA